MRGTLRLVGYMLPLLVLVVAVAPPSLSFVLGTPCSAQLGFPVIPVAYVNQTVPVVVPVSVTCSKAYGAQVYATASAYDLNTDTSASRVNTIMTSVDGGYTFTGQLGFSLPPSTQGHWMQIAVTVYESQAGGELTTASEAFPVTAGMGQVVTVTEQPSSAFAPSLSETNHSIFGFVAIAAILATVIIVTVALVAYSRRLSGSYSAPRTY